MYSIPSISDLNSLPWNMSYYDRCLILREYIQSNKDIITIVYDKADTSTFRYRGYNIFQALKNDSKMGCVFIFKDELDMFKPFIKYISCFTFVRVTWSLNVQNFIDKIKSYNIPVLFDVDDLVYDESYIPLIMNSLYVDTNLEINYNYWFSYIGRIGYIAKQADGFTTTNDFLGNKLTLKYNKPYKVIPNFYNNEQFKVSSKYIEYKSIIKTDSNFTIGYFSGTPSHRNDFISILPEIIRLLEKYDNIYLNVVGFMDFPADIQKYISDGRVKFKTLVDFLELQRLIAEVDVNIVPLIINDFTNCKSELKYYESALVKTITCASPNYSYKKCIDDGVNGFLCDQGDWYKNIEKIYKGEVDYKTIVDNAYDHSVSVYDPNIVVDQIKNSYKYFIK